MSEHSVVVVNGPSPKCTTCGSPAPNLHPASRAEDGELYPCWNSFHEPSTGFFAPCCAASVSGRGHDPRCPRHGDGVVMRRFTCTTWSGFTQTVDAESVEFSASGALIFRVGERLAEVIEPGGWRSLREVDPDGPEPTQVRSPA